MVLSRGITAKALAAGVYVGFLAQQFPQSPTLGLSSLGADNFGADIFGALSFGGLILGGLIFGLQQDEQAPHFMHDIILAQQETLGTFGASNFGADNFGALSFGGLMDGGLIFGLQQEEQAPHLPIIPAQQETLGTFGASNFGASNFGAVSLGADNFGALSLGGLMLGAFNFGLQQAEQAPQPAHEATQFYQHPTFLPILGPSSFGPDILGFAIGVGLSAAFNLSGPFLSTLPAAGINIA